MSIGDFAARWRISLRWGWAQTTAVVIAVVAVVVDQVSKNWALANVAEDARRPVLGEVVTLQLVHNPGAAFSMGEGSTWIFTVLSVIVLLVIAAALPVVGDTATVILLGFLAGGAAGNLIDRMIRPPGVGVGHVVDFINYNGWFVGNIADVFIVGGALALVVAQLFRREPVDPAARSIGEGGAAAAAPSSADRPADPEPLPGQPPSFPPKDRR